MRLEKVLKKTDGGQLADWIYTVREGEKAEGIDPHNIVNKAPDHKIDALEYWGEIKGKDLIDWGMSKSKIKNPNKREQSQKIRKEYLNNENN